MRHTLLIALAITLTMLQAKVITVTAKGVYEMQRGDSKEDARTYALMYAKMNAVEEAGTVVRSVFESKANSNGKRFATHDLKSYSAAMIKSTVKKVGYKGRTCTVTVQAKLDTKDVDEYLKADSSVKEQIAEIIKTQQRILEELSGKANAASSNKKSTSTSFERKVLAASFENYEHELNVISIKGEQLVNYEDNLKLYCAQFFDAWFESIINGKRRSIEYQRIYAKTGVDIVYKDKKTTITVHTKSSKLGSLTHDTSWEKEVRKVLLPFREEGMSEEDFLLSSSFYDRTKLSYKTKACFRMAEDLSRGKLGCQERPCAYISLNGKK